MRGYTHLNQSILVGTLREVAVRPPGRGGGASATATVHIPAANGDVRKDSHVPVFVRGNIAEKLPEWEGQIVEVVGQLDCRPPNFQVRVMSINPVLPTS